MKSLLTFLFFAFAFGQIKAQHVNPNLQPAILVKMDKTTGVMQLDFLQQNPKFVPGASDFFLNQSKKIRSFEFSKNTPFYECEGNTPTKRTTSLSLIEKRFLQSKKEKTTAIFYFEIKENTIVAVYEQCLP